AGTQGEVAGDVGGDIGALLVQVLDCVSHLVKLVLEPRAEMFSIDLRAHRAYSDRASRRSASAVSMPCSSTILSRLDGPDLRVRLLPGRSRRSASSRRTASFALPPSGAALTRTLHPSPRPPPLPLAPPPPDPPTRHPAPRPPIRPPQLRRAHATTAAPP